MKYINKIFILAALSLLPAFVFGQYTEDIFRVSNLPYKGTARYMGMSGAFGAVGGDFTTLSVNPAGIGTYNKFEILFSPTLLNTKAKADFFKEESIEHQTHCNFNNIGIVLPFTFSDDKTLRQFSLAFGFNRLQDFNYRSSIVGFNDQNSLLTCLASEANAFGVDIANPIYPEDLAASTLLLFQDTLGVWHNDLPNGGIWQNGYQNIRGSLDELVASMGFNVRNKIFIGFTVGMPFYKYKRSFEYTEKDEGNLTDPFHSMTCDEDLKIEGRGVNAKFGVIFKPLHILRLGFAVHTPTYYWKVYESWNCVMNSQFDYKIEDPYNPPQYVSSVSDKMNGDNDYELHTPMRIIGSAAVTVANIGLFSVDYEWVNQSNGYASPETTFRDLNQAMRSTYSNQHIIRFGTEWRLSDFYLRGGYAWYSNPFKNNINNGTMHTWSLGCGFRIKKFGFDFAYQRLIDRTDYYIYNYPIAQAVAKMKNATNHYVTTFSFRF